jgi:hypothetical protein
MKTVSTPIVLTVYVHEYVRMRFGKVECVTEHWRGLPHRANG